MPNPYGEGLAQWEAIERVMTVSSQTVLRRLFLAAYDDLKLRLTRRLGSADQATDALHETFLRLEKAAVAGPVLNPNAYFFRAALNVATNQRIADTRRLDFMDIEDLLDIPDQGPDPARAMEARSEIDALKRALAELSPRRREMFLAVWVEEKSHQEIAERFGVTIRTVQAELKLVLEHCARRMQRTAGKNLRLQAP
jgi:RNA polymerase sigma-70 factor, ECF subfamily